MKDVQQSIIETMDMLKKEGKLVDGKLMEITTPNGKVVAIDPQLVRTFTPEQLLEYINNYPEAEK
jgi:hypothetical protein